VAPIETAVPVQTVDAEATAAAGSAFTVKVTEFELTQLLELVSVSV